MFPTLHWSEVRPYTSLAEIEPDFSGIYIWCLQRDGVVVPYYVGKAYKVLWRLTDHMREILGGNYTIYPANRLMEFRQVLPSEIIYKVINYKTKVEFLFRKDDNEFKKHLDAMVSAFAFTYCKLDFDMFRSHGHEVENYVMDYIGRSKLANMRYVLPTREFDLGNLKEVLPSIKLGNG